MIVRTDGGYPHYKPRLHFNICPGCSFSAISEYAGEIAIDPIPEFCCVDSAKAAGWEIRTNRKWCSPGQESVWICPECAKRERKKSMSRKLRNKIRPIMGYHGMSINALSKRTKISRQTLYNVIDDGGDCRLSIALKLGKGLGGYKVEEMFDLKEAE